MDEAARGLMRVAEQPLTQRQRINGQRQTVHHGVPAVGFAIFHGGKIALHPALISQRTEFLELRLTDPAAGRGQIQEHRLAGELPVERDEFADFIPTGVNESLLDCGQFVRQQDAFVVGP